MLLLVVIVVTLLSGGTFLAGAALCFSEPSRRLRLAFVGSFVLGCAAAVWCAFFVWYQPRPTLRVRGVPMPSQMLQLENGDWVPFEGPGWIVNLVVVTSVVTMPVAVALIVRKVRRVRSEGQRGFSVW